MDAHSPDPPPGQTTLSVSDFSKALKTLPSCQRCQQGRRKCDTLIPSCSRCARAKEECLFYDHALKQVLPRSYIHSLIKSAENLQRQIADNRKIGQKPYSPRDTLTTPNPQAAHSSSGGDSSIIPVNSSVQHQTGFHFPVTTHDGPTLRYFGSSSVFSLAVHIMTRVRNSAMFSLPPINSAILTDMEPSDFHGGCDCTITKSMVERSLELYMDSIHVLYPFLDESTVLSDLEDYWDIQSSGIDPSGLKGHRAHHFFRIKIIAAIASASRSRYNASRIACDHGCYVEATKCIAEVTSEVSADSLRALMLLIVYCLFRPRKGDIWRLLDYACRLCLELGYHTELGSDSCIIDREQQKKIFWSLYTLENIVSQLFGRPSDFPDAIVTTEYPASSPTESAELNAVQIQSLFTVQHWKLVSIRSKLFTELYLPNGAAYRDMSWYQKRLNTLDAWYAETIKTVALVGVGELTCTVAFHATILFLFQPLVMDLLCRPADSNTPPGRMQFVPEEIFLSAGRLVEVYEEIVQAPRNGALGTYPMTFMSAHYIFLASMMIKAYCLFYLDGNTTFHRTLSDPKYIQETGSIDLENICRISNSCLILLTFCHEKWPGLVGMRDVYRQLSDQLLKRVLQKYHAEGAQSVGTHGA
ncbi:hypothetical protein PV08_05718 [Exophiala spinifera]|uniref:Zn(2)-C6 fungal-type domain-containing protein n=1 Tax=Exophiala spinifera TaxID=91928 RepID=A0A0D2BWK9_9EURO|nr:uncharacterized protein PV08_05718 [Exophiala spinifera]KIW15669.1 hypothetical protein PV08_05718 [Exophiala spinifera]